MNITTEEFQAYEAVRESGETNMFDAKAVIALSDGVLDREKVLYIMEHYDDLIEALAAGTLA